MILAGDHGSGGASGWRRGRHPAAPATRSAAWSCCPTARWATVPSRPSCRPGLLRRRRRPPRRRDGVTGRARRAPPGGPPTTATGDLRDGLRPPSRRASPWSTARHPRSSRRPAPAALVAGAARRPGHARLGAGVRGAVDQRRRPHAGDRRGSPRGGRARRSPPRTSDVVRISADPGVTPLAASLRDEVIGQPRPSTCCPARCWWPTRSATPRASSGTTGVAAIPCPSPRCPPAWSGATRWASTGRPPAAGGETAAEPRHRVAHRGEGGRQRHRRPGVRDRRPRPGAADLRRGRLGPDQAGRDQRAAEGLTTRWESSRSPRRSPRRASRPPSPPWRPPGPRTATCTSSRSTRRAATWSCGSSWPRAGLVTLAATGRRPGAGHLPRPHAGAAVRRGDDGPARRILVAPVAADQASAALGALRGGLPKVLAQLEADVLVDCGRLDPYSPAFEFATHADLLVVVTRPILSEIHHLAARLPSVRARAVSLLVVGDSPYGVTDVAVGGRGHAARHDPRRRPGGPRPHPRPPARAAGAAAVPAAARRPVGRRGPRRLARPAARRHPAHRPAPGPTPGGHAPGPGSPVPAGPPPAGPGPGGPPSSPGPRSGYEAPTPAPYGPPAPPPPAERDSPSRLRRRLPPGGPAPAAVRRPGGRPPRAGPPPPPATCRRRPSRRGPSRGRRGPGRTAVGGATRRGGNAKHFRRSDEDDER